jgi:hypothetical protein
MATSIRIEPIDRDIRLILDENLSPQARSHDFADFAQDTIDQVEADNASILGRVPRSKTFVDGRETNDLYSVRPDGGIIVAEFELIDDALQWIAQQLEQHSPVKTGRYQKSHTLFADGQEVAIGGTIPEADEYVFTNSVPYARKIERGSSSQAPDGVYQAVASLAQRRFGNIARITFGYRTAIGGTFVGGRAGNRSENRNPAIIVRLRS